MYYLKGLVVFCLFILSNISLNAQVSWDGDGDGTSWSDPANWSGDILPGPFDSVTIDLDVNVLADSTIHFAGSLRIGPMDTLSMSGSFVISNWMKIDSLGVFHWMDADLDWPKIDNYGKILVSAKNIDLVENGMQLINNQNASIVVLANPGIAVDSGTIINHGLIQYNSPDIGGLLSSTNSGNKCINHANGVIRFSSNANSYSINIPFYNYGLVIVDSNTLNITDTTLLFEGSDFECAQPATILFKSDILSFRGNVSGNVLGQMEIQCPFESQNGSLTFTGNGLKWTDKSYINGDTLFNRALLVIEGNLNNFIEDSGVLFNQGIVDFLSFNGFQFMSGEFINDNVIRYEHGGRIDLVGNGYHRFINTASGEIKKFSGPNTTINVDFENYGVIQCNMNEIRFNGSNYDLNAGTQLITELAGIIHFMSGTVHINDTLTGDASGKIFLNTDWTSNNGAANFQEDGFIWRSQSLIGGSTFTNLGEMHLGDNFKYLEDSSTFVNEGILISDVNGNLWFEDGLLINDSIIQFINGVGIYLNGGNQHTIINNPGAIIFSDGTSVAADVENYGILHALDGNFVLNGLKKFYDQSELITTDTSAILLQNNMLELSGQIKGYAPTPIVLNCNTRSNNATINIGANGVNWSGGTIMDSDTLTNQSMITVSTGTNHILQDSVVFVNEDTMSIPNISGIRIENGQLINKAYISMQGTGSLTWFVGTYHEVINDVDGLIDRIDGIGSSVIKPDLMNYGVMRVQAGSLDCQGNFVNQASGQLEGTGSFKFVSPYTNIGSTSPGLSPGILTFNNRFIQDSSGVLNLEISGTTAGTDYDQLSAFFVELNGEISVDLGFTPSVGELFDIVVAGNSGMQLCNVSDTITACGLGGLFAVHCLGDRVQLEYAGAGLGGSTLPSTFNLLLDSMSGTAHIDPNVFAGVCDVDSISLSQTDFDCNDADTIAITATVYVSGVPSMESIDVILLKPFTTNIWVNPTATGSGFGLSPEHGYANLNQALSVSHGCLTALQSVSLVAGTYIPDNMGTANRHSSFILPDNFQLLGGFSPDGSTRDPAVYASILSGDIGAQGISTDNVYHVITIADGLASVSLDGVIIAHGQADAPGFDKGAGILVGGTCNMEKVTIMDNFASSEGSAIYVKTPDGNLILGADNRILPHNGPGVLFIEVGAETLINDNTQID
jgi:hypothetical protein